MRNYATYVEEGLLKNLESPFDDVVEQSIIGGDRFVDKVKREYLLMRSGDTKEEPALLHLVVVLVPVSILEISRIQKASRPEEVDWPFPWSVLQKEKDEA